MDFYLFFSLALGITNLILRRSRVNLDFTFRIKKQTNKRASDWLPLTTILDWMDFDVREILIGCSWCESNCTLICPNYFGDMQSPRPSTLNLTFYISLCLTFLFFFFFTYEKTIKTLFIGQEFGAANKARRAVNTF